MQLSCLLTYYSIFLLLQLAIEWQSTLSAVSPRDTFIQQPSVVQSLFRWQVNPSDARQAMLSCDTDETGGWIDEAMQSHHVMIGLCDEPTSEKAPTGCNSRHERWIVMGHDMAMKTVLYDACLYFHIGYRNCYISIFTLVDIHYIKQVVVPSFISVTSL